MSVNKEANPRIQNGTLSFLKEQLADFLTLSRIIIGLTILSLSFVGQEAYIAVVILVLIGAATDIFDGKAARRYLGEGRESKLGKFDLEVDTFFVLCAICYFSFSDIIIPKIAGIGWIGLAVIAVVLYKRKPKVLLLFEVPSVIALLIVAGVYNLKIFTLIIIPAMVVGLIINRKRVLYLVFEYWPRIFSE